MVSHSVAFPSVVKICARIKQLGYAAVRRIRLYGEKSKVVSDPVSSSHWGCSSNDDETRLTHSLATDFRDRASGRKKGGGDCWPPSVLREP
jgi:hypothetical protein